MNLPNYFIADLPSEAVLSASMITEACQTLKRNRERFLLPRSTESIIRLISAVADDWLQPESPFRQRALELGPSETGFSIPTLSQGLDAFFSQLTSENLESLMVQELGHLERLDKPVAIPEERLTRRMAWARGPSLIAHIASGNIPCPTLMSMVLGLLCKSAQFVKCASSASLLPRLFAHSIYEREHKIGACIELACWKGGHRILEHTLFQEADCVTVTGEDATIASIKPHLPVRTRLLAYGHKVSFGYISGRIYASNKASSIVAHAAADVVAWNQLGCLSPHVFYVEDGNLQLARRFAADLAKELEHIEEIEPRGVLPVNVSARLASRRSFYEVRAAHSPETQCWFSPESTAWSVVYESDPLFQTSCCNRFIYVKPVSSLGDALHAADPIRDDVSTVGLAATKEEYWLLAEQLAQWGALRVCPIGQMQKPPLLWRHDGRPPLADLVSYSDFEH